MFIENNLLKSGNVEFIESPNHGEKFGENLPDTIILHFTADANEESTVNWLTNTQSRASAHLVVGRDNLIYQLVPFDTIAWHVGRSTYEGRTGYNKYSIGIEIDNAGILKKSGNNYRAWFGKSYPEEDIIKECHKNESVERYWHAYKRQQIETIEDICSLLIQKYNIKHILGHDEVSPRTELDPGPAFPIEIIRNRLLGEGKNVDEGELEPSKGKLLIDTQELRSEPGIESEVIPFTQKKGSEVSIVETRGKWVKIESKLRGWVNKDYLKI